MRKYILLHLLLASICGAGLKPAMGQGTVFPVQVQAFPLVNATVYLSDFADPAVNASRLQFDVTLFDPVELSRDVYFRISIFENGTQVMRTVPGFIGPLVTLSKDVPTRITGLDLAPYLDRNNLVGVSGTGQANVLREGFNSICVEVIDLQRNEPISRRICAEGFWRRLDPPFLTLPTHNMSLTQAELVSQFFNWQVTDPLVALLGLQARIQYEYELRELPPGMNPQDAFDNYILVYSATTNTAVVLYNEIVPGLEAGKTYAWRVRAIIEDDMGQALPGYFNNNGYSVVSTFQVTEDVVVEIPDGYACDCTGPQCQPATPDNTVPASSLAIGDDIQVGLFQVTLTELAASSGASASGKGTIRVPFINLDVEVAFDNIQVNTNKQVFAGRLRMDRNAIISGIEAKANGALDFPVIGDFTSGYVAQLSQLASQYTDVVPNLPLSLRTKMQGLGLALPTSADFIVTDMYFTPSGGAFDAMIVLPNGNGGFVRFGASGIGFRPSGIDFGNLVLFLGDDMALPGLGSVPLMIKKIEVADGNAGSFIAFDCNGFREFNLQAEYSFSTDQLVQADEPAAAVVAAMRLNSTQWGQFVASATMPPFSITGLPGWRFEAQNPTADFAVNQNLATMAFPEGYTGDTGAAWRGFYIQRLSLTLPDDLRMGSPQPISFAADNLIIDALGVSAGLRGVDLLSLATGNAGGWAFSMDTIVVNIAMNQLVNAQLRGGIELGILDAAIDYAGLLLKDPNGSYAFDLSPIGSFQVPFLKLDVNIEPGSVLSIRRPAAGQAYRPYTDLNISVGLNIGEPEFAAVGLGDLLSGMKTALGLSDFNFGVSDLHLHGLRINHPDLPPGRYIGLSNISGGSINIPGLDGISLDDLNFLDQETDFNGVSLPGLGLDFSLGFGPIGFGIGVWGKQTQAPGQAVGSGLPRFGFGKFELRKPSMPRLSFRCKCDAPPAQGDTPATNFCDAPVITGGTPATLQEGDQVKVGHFTLRVGAVSGNSGEGQVEIPFLAKLLDVEFSGIGVSTMPDGEKRVTSGFVVSKSTSLLPDDLVSNALAPVQDAVPFDLSALPVTDALMSNINDLAASAGAFFSLPFSIRHKMQEFLGVDLPDDVDFVLLGLRFEPGRARTSAMLTVKVGQDRYLKFGLAGMAVRPDGVNLDGIQIYLAEDFSFGF